MSTDRLLEELEANGVNVEGTTIWCEADRLDEDCCSQPEAIDCPRCGEEVCKNCGDCCDWEDMGW